MYQCEICSTCFDAPIIRHEANTDGENVWQMPYRCCPICGTVEYFHKVDLCECVGLKSPGELLCPKCRKALKKKVLRFFDSLDEQEREVFDDWMDGASIKDCLTFK